MRRLLILVVVTIAWLAGPLPSWAQDSNPSVAGSCVVIRDVGGASCTTTPTNRPRFLYEVLAPAPNASWTMLACGQQGCANANSEVSPKSGVLVAPGPCPCRAWILLGPPGEIVPNPLVGSVSNAVVVNL